MNKAEEILQDDSGAYSSLEYELAEEIVRTRPVVEDYLRQADGHERHGSLDGAFLSLGQQRMVDVAREYRRNA